jgi:fatty-acyl-CoA synthase
MSQDQTPWVHEMTIGDVLRDVARSYPDREALVFPAAGDRATWAEYDRRVDIAARGLLAMGIQRGDHVAAWATNWPQWTILQLAAARVGAVLCTINPAYRSPELAYVLEQADVVAIFLISRFKTSQYLEMLREVVPDAAKGSDGQVRSERFPKLRWVVSFQELNEPGMLSWGRIRAMGWDVDPMKLRRREATLAPDDPINLQYTSGTTGFPKGALLSHRNLLLNAYYVSQGLNLTEKDRVCVPVPFYHCFGCVIGTLASLVRGATMLVPAQYFDPVATLDCIEKERATTLYGVPTMFIAELDDPSFEGRDLSSLRTGIMAGSPCPIEVMNRVVDEMGVKEIAIAYGLTEASPAVTMTDVHDPVELRVTTVGKALPGVEVKVADEEGNALPDGEPGEICCRGHNVMVGYYKMPEATAESIDEDGWLHSGDIGFRDEDGYYRITGRIKDMIIRGGENVYPREIEEILFTHPAIAEAQVIGVPDSVKGEEVCAWIRLHRGKQMSEDEVQEFCRSRLAHFKVPRYVEFVEQFPETVTGKVQKFKMREEAIRRLGLDRQTPVGA